MAEDSNINQQETNEEALEIEEGDQPVSIWLRLKLFVSVHWRGIICLLTPIVLLPILLPIPPEKYQWCAYTLMLMAIYWVTECIPLGITSFLPVIIFPLTGIMSTRTTCECYMNDTIIMFLGSMALAYAVAQSGLHKRIALCTVRAIGYSHYSYTFYVLFRSFYVFGLRLLFALSFTTMFISMWITNTAATTMMVPINFALLRVFEDLNLLSIYKTSEDDDVIASDITTCYFCTITFSATIGGIGTLVGTATNLVFKGLFERTYPDAPEYLSFPFFSAFSVPFMLAMEMSLYMYMIYAYFGFLRPNSPKAKKAKISEEGIEVAKNMVNENWKKLGHITFWEIMVIILFVTGMLLFCCRSPQFFPGWADQISEYYGLKNNAFILDSAVAMLVVFAMLSLPSTTDFLRHFTAKEYDDLPNKPVESILNWDLMNVTMPYSFMFLLGGGFALAKGAKKEYSDLNGQIGILLKSLEILPNYFIILLIIVFTVILTNFASNVATANVVVPLAMQLAQETNVHPLWYNIAAGFSASFCFCLPVGTPGNIIVQSAARIPTITMIKAGIIPTIAVIAITWFCVYFWAPVVWPNLTWDSTN